MPTFDGFEKELREVAEFTTVYAQRPANYDMWQAAADVDPTSHGDFDNNQPGDRYGTASFDGAVEYSYFDDYYNRIWLIPAELDFGPITSDVSRSVLMWNSNSTAVTLDSFDLGVDESISLSGLSLPLTIKSLGATEFLVNVSQDGDSEVQSTVTFEFTPEEVASIPVSGVRSKVWAFLPNWSNPVEVQFEYMTEIIESRSGYEQRIAARTEPRLSISFTSIVNDFNYRQFIRQMASWQNKPTLMPDFSHGVALSVAADNMTDTLVLDHIEDWMVEGRAVLIVRGAASRTEFLVRKIAEVIGDSIRLTSNIEGSWGIGTKVYPTYSGYLGSRISASQPGNRTSIVNVSFNADPGYELWADPGEIVPDYLGREMFMLRPDWSSALTPDFEASVEVVDYGRGRKAHSFSKPYNVRYHKANYVGIGRAATDEIVRFFKRNLGAQGEFFMPTFTEDLRLKMVSPSATASMRFDGLFVYQDYVEDVVYRDLIIFYTDGTHEAYHVDSIGTINDDYGNDSIINLTTPLLREVDPDEILQICWLPLWRFATDGLTVQWLTDETSQISLTMRTLPYVAAET